MKFAKELDEQAIPEWKDKYFDYKGAKKKLKAVGRAAKNVDRPGPLTPRGSFRRSPFGNSSSVRDAPVFSFLTREQGEDNDVDAQDANRQHPLRAGRPAGGANLAASPQYPKGLDADEEDRERTPRQGPVPIVNERSPLRGESGGRDGAPRLARYGSIIGSPPSGNSPLPDLTPQATRASLLELPDPAMDPEGSNDSTREAGMPGLDGAAPETSELRHPDSTRRQFAHTGNAYEIDPPKDQAEPPLHKKKKGLSRHTSFFLPKRASSMPRNKGDGDNPRPLMHRVFSLSGAVSGASGPSPGRPRSSDVALESYREVDFRRAEFFLFLDKQFDKIEEFYQLKEDEATARLGVLREQLHVLRNRRLEEILASEQRQGQQNDDYLVPTNSQVKDWSPGQYRENAGHSLAYGPGATPQGRWNSVTGEVNGGSDINGGPPENGHPSQPTHDGRLASISTKVNDTLAHVTGGYVGKTSKAMGQLGTPDSARFRMNPNNQDYTRRKVKEQIPAYRAAKRKLKTAMQEYYRGLELLKSYALLNRTAFRKINKKFDKTVNVSAGGTMRYMSEKVNKAHFVNSDVVDGHLQSVEDLYARYFERGNRKVAIGKLRGKVLKLGDYTGALCRTGFFLGSGIVLGIQGLVYGILDLYDGNATIELWATYLLQIYAGYFLLLFLVGLFCIDARIFSRAKVNYQFVFEFDARHTLDWRQLCEIPSVFFFLLALSMYVNFTVRAGGDAMYIYWPVVLVGLSIIIMFLPPPLFYWESRRWFLYANWRLLLAGWYAVEFRDFFLGDMFCSQTYAMGNIELFFCAYAQEWNTDTLPTCSSSSSRWLGVLSTLPGISRALQCLRRYKDTRNVFPHLVNCGKYMFTIAQYATLSAFRISKTSEMKALFIACSTINAIYCSVWDIAMDWSLGDFNAKHRGLRNTLAYKRHIWAYYLAIIIDPILRFNWIFYAIFADDVQHSSVISFCVAFSEVIRRGIWTIFRVENEHCTNVSRNRAARDVELPYQRTSDELIDAQFDGVGAAEDAPTNNVSGTDEESAPETDAARPQQSLDSIGRTTSRDQYAGNTTTPSSASFLRQRRQATESPVAQALRRVGSTMATAHAQDYERKKKPVQGAQEEEEEEDDDDDDDDEEDQNEEAEVEELNHRAGAGRIVGAGRP